MRIRSQSASKRTSEIMTDTLSLYKKYEEVKQDPLPTSPTLPEEENADGSGGGGGGGGDEAAVAEAAVAAAPWTPMVKLRPSLPPLRRKWRRATSRILGRARRWMPSKLKRPRKKSQRSRPMKGEAR